MKFSDKRRISERLMGAIDGEIRMATKRLGLMDKEVAAKMGFTAQYYSRMRHNPEQVMKFLERIANALECDLDVRFIPRSRKK